MAPIRLADLRQAAALLQTHAKQADANGNGHLTLKEINAHAKAQGDRFATGKALLTLRSWALWETGGSRNVSVADLQAKAADAVLLLERRDLDGNGTLDEGSELKSVKRLKTFDALSSMVVTSPFIEGDSFYQLKGRSELLSTTRYTDPGQVPAELHQAIITAANESSYASTTLAEVFAQVDQGEVMVRHLREPTSGKELLVVDYGAGDNTYGAIFDPVTKQLLAGIGDGDILPRQ